MMLVSTKHCACCRVLANGLHYFSCHGTILSRDLGRACVRGGGGGREQKGRGSQNRSGQGGRAEQGAAVRQVRPEGPGGRVCYRLGLLQRREGWGPGAAQPAHTGSQAGSWMWTGARVMGATGTVHSLLSVGAKVAGSVSRSRGGGGLERWPGSTQSCVEALPQTV